MSNELIKRILSSIIIIPIALFFIILDVFLLERKTAWLKRLNLFNENS